MEKHEYGDESCTKWILFGWPSSSIYQEQAL